MALRNAAGTVLTRAQALALTTAVVDDPEITFTDDVYEDTEFEGGGDRQGEQLKWRAGETIKQSEFDAIYPLPTVTAIAPDNGGAAGGTAVTITGTGFVRGEQVIGAGGVKPTGQDVTVTVGGVAATNVIVEDDGMITCDTPAHAAGATDVVVTTAAGPSTALAGGFTYA